MIPTEFGDSAVTLECRFWIRQPNAHKKWTTLRAVVHALKAADDREGIGIPYPQRELSSRADSGFRIPDAASAEQSDATGTGGAGDELRYSESDRT